MLVRFCFLNVTFFPLKLKMIFVFSLETQLFLFVPLLCIGQFCSTYFVKITYAYENLHVIFKNANAFSFGRKKTYQVAYQTLILKNNEGLLKYSENVPAVLY